METNTANTTERFEFNEIEKNQLATNNMNLIHKVAHSFYNTTRVEYNEIFGVASEGFVRALNSYEPDRGAKFSTYAVSCMHKQVLFYLRGELKRKRMKTTSLDEIMRSDDGGDAAVADSLIFEKMVNEGSDLNCVEAGYQRAEMESYMKEKFGQMDKAAVTVLIMHYGLFETPEYTQQEIAESLGISQGSVSKIEKKALEEFGKTAFMEYCNTGAPRPTGKRVIKRVARPD